MCQNLRFGLCILITILCQSLVLSTWPLLNASDVTNLNLYPIMVPKAGSTTLGIASNIIRCHNGNSSIRFMGSLPCKTFCHKYYLGTGFTTSLPPQRGACSPTGGHDPRFQFCHRGIYGLDSVLSNTANWEQKPLGGGRQGHLCMIMLRNPWARAVSGWMYPHHSPSGKPGDSGFGVIWPPSERRRLKFVWNAPADEHVWLNDSSKETHRVTFDEYVTSAAYSNVQTRMLGENGFAYDASVRVDSKSLERAMLVLKRVPFGMMEEVNASYLLFAREFSTNREFCSRLVGLLKSIVTSGTRRHKRNLPAPKGHRKNGFTYEEKSASIIGNDSHRFAFESVNEYDLALYASAQSIWCDQWRSALRAAPGRSCLPEVAETQFGPFRTPDLCLQEEARESSAS